MSIRLLISMSSVPGKSAEFIKARLPRSAEIRKDAGCEQFDVFQNVENPDQFLLVEKWKDEESLQAHYAIKRPQVAPELRVPSTGKNEKYIMED